jgi:tetratricopeptide (TPR) repeat protein
MEHHKKNKPGFSSIFSIFTKAFALNCPDCGETINEDDSICPGCGTDLDAPLAKAELRSISQSYLEEARKILNKGGDFHQGLDYCDQVLEYDPECAEAYNLRGLFLDGLDSPEEAIESYRKALEIRPAYFDALDNLREAEEEYQRRYGQFP